MCNGDSQVYKKIYQDPTLIQTAVREQHNYGLSNILENNGFAIARFNLMGNTKYYLKGWIQNPSGSVVEAHHNFTSKIPDGDSGLGYKIEYKIAWEETTIPKYRGKRSFLDLIYEKVLTDLMCTLVTGANIRPDTAVDVDGYTCEQRKQLGLTRILQATTTDTATPAAATTTPAADATTPAADATTPAADATTTPKSTTDASSSTAVITDAAVKFDKTYTFYVNSNDLVTDDDTILKVKMYLGKPKTYIDAIDVLLHKKADFPYGWPNSTSVNFY